MIVKRLSGDAALIGQAADVERGGCCCRHSADDPLEIGRTCHIAGSTSLPIHDGAEVGRKPVRAIGRAEELHDFRYQQSMRSQPAIHTCPTGDHNAASAP